MTEYMVIRLPAVSEQPLSWLIADDSGQPFPMPESAGLDEALRRTPQKPVLVLVPGEQVLYARPTLPVRGAARMLQAAPYALEEQLADDIKHLHFAIGRRAAGGEVPVVAVSKTLMSQWVAQLQAASIVPVIMLPDTFGVPVHEGYSIVLEQNRSLIRAPDGNVLVAETDAVATFIQAMGALPEEAPADSHLYLSEDDSVAYARSVAELRMILPELTVHEVRSGILPVLAATAIASTGPNLLQGHFSVSSNTNKYWKPWRTAAILAGVFLITTLGVKATEVIGLRSELRDLTVQLNEVATETLGGKVVDPMLQLEQRLAALRNTSGGSDNPFLEILETLGGVLGSVGATTIGKLDYRNGTMDLTLTVPSVDTLDRIRSGVEAGGHKADIQSANTRDDGAVQGRLRISEQRS